MTSFDWRPRLMCAVKVESSEISRVLRWFKCGEEWSGELVLRWTEQLRISGSERWTMDPHGRPTECRVCRKLKSVICCRGEGVVVRSFTYAGSSLLWSQVNLDQIVLSRPSWRPYRFIYTRASQQSDVRSRAHPGAPAGPPYFVELDESIATHCFQVAGPYPIWDLSS